MKSLIASILILSAICHSHHEFKEVNDLNLIREVNELQTNWKAGVNERFKNLTHKDIKKQLGSLKTPEHLKLKVKTVQVVENLPGEFDPRIKWAQCSSLKEIRDQSACGSCWAFGAAEAMSDRICIASNGTLQTRVSAETLVACCNECGDGCDGGYPDAAWNYWQESGLPSGGLFEDHTTCQPYAFAPCDHHVDGQYKPCSGDYPTPSCSKKCDSQSKKDFKKDLSFATDAYALDSNEEQIKSELFTYGPVEAAFTVYEDFLTYKSGVYKHVKGSALGGHAVKVIGWGVEAGVNYWLVVNSWNEDWGDKGTFKILRGKDHCGIESQMVAGTPRVSKNEEEEDLIFLN